MLGLNFNDEPTIGQQFENAMPSIPFKVRMIIFVCLFALGWIINFVALAMLPKIKSEPQRFASLWTLGNAIALSSTLFLWGPVKQIKIMFDCAHLPYTLVYLAAMITTIIVAYKDGRVGWVVFCLIIQLLTMILYTVSMFPMGPKIIGLYARRIFCCEK